MATKTYISNIHDPYFNLALEDYLLKSVSQGESFLLLYINWPCVVMGRFQNPWIECNLKKMHHDSIELVRRQSGGGTVYHDLNNVNYSLISPKSSYNKDQNFDFLVEVLGKLKIKAFKSQRGDLRLDEKETRKISGTAYKEKKDSAFQHGTMLINTDLNLLNLYIEPSLLGVKSKSIDSIRSTVANLSMVNPLISNSSFIQSAGDLFSVDENIIEINKASEFAQKILNSPYYSSLKDINWKYSETPQFEIKDAFGETEIILIIKKLKLTHCEIVQKSQHPLLVNAIKSRLIGCHLFDVNQLLSEEFSGEDFAEDLGIWFTRYFDLDSLP